MKADRKLALQTMLFSPGITDMEVAEKILNRYLSVHRRFLPKFT